MGPFKGNKVWFSCPNCRPSVHAVPEAGQFPVSYTIEKLLRMLRRTSLASTPPSAEKDTAEPAHSPGTRPGEKGQTYLNDKVRSLLEKQEAKILAAIHNCQKVKAQLNQYETTVRGWGRQQQNRKNRLQTLVDPCIDARMLAQQEELSTSDKRQQVDQGEQQLHTLLQAVRKAASAGEAYETIVNADHVMEEQTQREEECLAMFPDVHTVTTIKKVIEVSHAALEAAATVQAAQQTAGVGGGAAGHASLPAAAASSIRDRVDVLMSQPLKICPRGAMEPARMDDKTAQLTLGRRDSREDDVQDCPMCMTVFDEIVQQRPRTLPCGHTFCTPCVNGLNVQGLVTCHNCHVVHAVPEVGHFPISFTIENLIRRMRRTLLASTPPSAEKDTAEPAHSLETRPGEKGQQGLNKKVRSLLEKQEAKILAAINNCQKVKAQLNQHETTVRGWGRQQLSLEDRLQSLVDQCNDARMLAQQEELSASDKRQQVNHGEHQLHTLLQAVRTAASGVEAYKTIEDSDHVMEEETQREKECLAMFPDVHTVTTIKKAVDADPTIDEIRTSS
ncbi:hypothetical protein GWK47_032685 [Chionoecetes opilio]|uniref:RING-type domain-containing protein n=1 Tax=Chionoecetes opilio TaxID=41210 RepID=A0A8J4YVY1_CHIOP|nr:hypothetical protein GWK47_032685 [Chionoecetes opilio]